MCMVLLLDSLRYICTQSRLSLLFPDSLITQISYNLQLCPSNSIASHAGEICTPISATGAVQSIHFTHQLAGALNSNVFNMHPVLIMKYLPIERSHSVITWHDPPCKVLANRRRHCTAFLVKLILFHLSLFAHIL